MSFNEGDTVRCINHPFLQDIVGTVLYTNGYFAKIQYTCNTEHIKKTFVLAVYRLIKHTPQESPLILKIKELEYRFKNKNSPNPYAPFTGYEEEDEEDDEEYIEVEQE